MGPNQSRLIGLFLLGAAVVIISRTFSDDGRPAAETRVVRHAAVDGRKFQEELDQATARTKSGAYIAASKYVSDHEEIETVVIPEGRSSDFDTRCLVYKNYDLKTSSITCSGLKFTGSHGPPS